MPIRTAPMLGMLLALAACATFPELDAANSAAKDAVGGAPPALLPMDQILGAAGTPPDGDPAGAALAGRAAALKARADALRGG